MDLNAFFDHEFDEHEAVIRATNVFIRNNAVVTHDPNTATTNPGGVWPVDGRVYIECGDCTIDAGENFITVPAGRDVGWGWSLSGGTKPSDDATPIASNSGSSFATPSGAPATWVLFRPDGTPLGFDASCNVGAIGSGNGAIYLSNGTRDYAITLRALGSVKVHSWNAGAGWEG